MRAFHRGDFTAHLITELSTVVLVGDGEGPDAGGWDDDPNAAGSSYHPYTVLNPLTTQEATGSIGDSNSEIRAPYSMTSYGVSREQVEFFADKAREVAVGLARSDVLLGEDQWEIQQVRVSSIGGVARNDSVRPSEFSQTDVVMIYLSKEL